MKFTQATAAAVLLATSALAAPAPAKQGSAVAGLDKERAARRIQEFSRKRRAAAAAVANGTADAATDTQNWGGAEVSNTGITAAVGSLTVPTVSFPANAGTPDGSEEYYGCAWVGIDGTNNCAGLQQAGAYWEAMGGGDFSYYGFYEWYPNAPVLLDSSQMTVTPGDGMTVNIVATTTTSGTFSMSDTTNGQTFTTSLAGQPALCGNTVEWIVEDNLPSEAPYADFGSVTFTAASYTAGGTGGLGVSGAEILNIDNNNVQWTNCGVSGANTVTCSYMS